MKKLLAAVLAIALIAAVSVSVPASASADGPAATVAKKGKGKKKGKKNKKNFTVCAHGCKYKTIQKAVDKVKKKNSTIKVKPGKYKEGVVFDGHKYDGLTIKGTKSDPSKVVLDGKNAKDPFGGIAQNGIEGIDAKNVTLENMTAKNYATNGFFLHDSEPAPATKIDCSDFLMKNLVAKYNRSYGLYVFGCAGGKMTKSMGTGHGDSAFYVGGTPIQDDPTRTVLTNLDAHENVLGYSGTNSRYVTIKNSDWYNNGLGLVPNTLDSEPFEPTSDGIIENNAIFWNNYNYYLPNSKFETVSGGLGTIEISPGNEVTLNYPTGIGVALFGATGWTVRNNDIFGNFKWGSAVFSDPFNEDDNAISTDNQFIDNQNGRGGEDTNGLDFWNDGSGSGNCFSGNESSTNSGATNGGAAPGHTEEFLYPECPAPASSGTGTSNGDPFQVAELVSYSGATPPENMECSWTEHEHPPYEDFEPSTVEPGPTCP